MPMQSPYVLLPDTRIHKREAYTGIRYSDGEETEKRLLESILSCEDISVDSTELRRHIVDWPSEYHFSPLRANLLRPFDLSDKKILELGCGCGAITRYLGEQGATVTAVEGSIMRAGIAAARTRDLPNVQVYCDDLIEFEGQSEFDIVTLIGVLEYSRLFLRAEDPVQHCLRNAGSLLNRDGELFIAIENQLGLKYFNGCNEDHTGIPYFGIHDLYSEATPITFGRRELIERLQAAGFEEIEFYYPFPDYKLPELLLSEAALDHRTLRVGDLLSRISSRDYGQEPCLSFTEGLAWQTLARNGLIGELANSFLVRARKRKNSRCPEWLVKSYSTGRLPEFAAETSISDFDQKIRVVKRPLHPIPRSTVRFEHLADASGNYVLGELYIVSLQKMAARGVDIDEIAAWAGPWLDYLRAHMDENGLLPEHFIDCIPTNIVKNEEGLHYIDVEWQARSRIPFSWVAVRGLMIAISFAPSFKAIEKMSYRQFLSRVLEKKNVRLTDADWNELVKWEDELWSQCYGNLRGAVSFDTHLERTDLPWTAYPTCRERLQLAELELKKPKLSLYQKLMRLMRRTLKSAANRIASTCGFAKQG